MQPDQSFFPPRDPFDLCLLFEEMLRTPLSGQEVITDQQLRELEQLGILNRIFRRWSQTTWGRQNWSRHFAGRTPRQELAILYPDLNAGDTYISVHLEQYSEGIRIEPVFSPQKENLVFNIGLNKIKDHPFDFVEPFFDVGFSSFASYMSGLVSHIPKKPDLFFFWRSFSSQVGWRIIEHTKLRLDQRKKNQVSLQVQDMLEYVLHLCRVGNDDFFDLDVIMEETWDILQRVDKRLPSMNYMFSSPPKKGGNIPYEFEVLYTLGRAFDICLFFPADRYFGAVELVWTDHKNFFNELFALQEYFLADGFKKAMQKKNSKSSPDLDSPAELWYSPCTSFRFFPKFSKI